MYNQKPHWFGGCTANAILLLATFAAMAAIALSASGQVLIVASRQAPAATPTKAPCDCPCKPECKCDPCLCNVATKPVVSVVKAAATKYTPIEASVKVVTTTATGGIRPYSGTAICNRTVLTCAHGMSADTDVVTVDGKPAKVITLDHDRDLMILRTEHDLKPVTIAKQWPKRGEQVTGYGYEIKNNGVLWKYPSVVTLAYRGSGMDIALVTGAATAGRSGSGLFNSAGELIGVCRGAMVRRNESIYTGLDSIGKLIGQPCEDKVVDSKAYAAPDFTVIAPKQNTPQSCPNGQCPLVPKRAPVQNCPNGQCSKAPAQANPLSSSKPTVRARGFIFRRGR